MAGNSHQEIQQSLFERIQSGEWAPGEKMPLEVELSSEYGCARTTMNRAIRGLAERGIVERKRKGGTRVREIPRRETKLTIPIVRTQVEDTGAVYSHKLLKRHQKHPTKIIQDRLDLESDQKALFLETLHLADGRAFAFETRWVNTLSVPEILSAPLDEISANEWLVRTVPYTSGDLRFGATAADHRVADVMETKDGAPLFTLERTTWLGSDFITTVRLLFRPGFELQSKL